MEKTGHARSRSIRVHDVVAQQLLRAFDIGVSKSNGFYRLRVNDSKLEKVADLKNIRRFSDLFSNGSYWSGLAPGDVPLLSRDISTQETYSFDLQLP